MESFVATAPVGFSKVLTLMLRVQRRVRGRQHPSYYSHAYKIVFPPIIASIGESDSEEEENRGNSASRFQVLLTTKKISYVLTIGHWQQFCELLSALLILHEVPLSILRPR